jgi:hypothetical protein
MGKTYSEIDGTVRSFIESQHVFFVASASSPPQALVPLLPT